MAKHTSLWPPVMPTGTATPPASPAAMVAAIVVVVGALYLGRDILIPLALAILLSFMLAPVVTRLRRLGHVPSVLTAGLPRGLTRSRVIGPASAGADLAATIAAALDGLAAPMPDPASDDGGFRPARRPSPAASAPRDGELP